MVEPLIEAVTPPMTNLPSALVVIPPAAAPVQVPPDPSAAEGINEAAEWLQVKPPFVLAHA